MSTAAFTPGPWEFLEDGRTEEDGNACRPLTICASSEDLASIYSRDDATVNVSREQAIGNARLIASAPELLSALNEISLMWHAETIAIGTSTGDGMTSTEFEALMQRVEALTFPFRVPA